jgi:predicted ATP-binding protein involved in virulence
MAPENLARVTRIAVKGLFERYSHDVTLHLDERVTIIHGPNGVGKTVLLKLTSALLSGQFAEFSKVPFQTFEVSLSDGTVLGVRRPPTAPKSVEEKGITFYLSAADGEKQDWTVLQEPADILKLAIRIESESNWLARYSPEQFVDRRTEEILTPFEVVSRYAEYTPDSLRRKGIFSEPTWIKEIQKRVRVHFVETQRLFRFIAHKDFDNHRVYGGQPRYNETVKDNAKDLQRRISETLTSYAKVSQSLDQSFPERLLKGRTWDRLSIHAIIERMKALEDKRQKLKRIGLIEQDAAYPFDVSALEKADDSQRTVMTLYVEDTAQKLGVLDDLARRIDLMTENINKKFQHKSIHVSKDKGFEAVTDEGKSLELAALSSGEQHELVLLYDLLFRVRSNTLVLIDEPELSLHVTWQKSFLPDLLEIVSATKFDVLLATHSPFIVGDRSDLMTPLLGGDGTAEQ